MQNSLEYFTKLLGYFLNTTLTIKASHKLPKLTFKRQYFS